MNKNLFKRLKDTGKDFKNKKNLTYTLTRSASVEDPFLFYKNTKRASKAMYDTQKNIGEARFLHTSWNAEFNNSSLALNMSWFAG